MEKMIGLLTEDFRMYHDVVSVLKARDIPFLSLSFSDPFPSSLGVVITSPKEYPKVEYTPKVACESPEDCVAKALQLLKGKERYEEMVIGIDPGPRPGIAFLGDGEILEKRIAENPEGVAIAVARLLKNYPAEKVVLRIGHGDPTNRNRIINSLAQRNLTIEIVDEKGTTKRDRRRDDRRDMDAAVEIALSRGIRAQRRYDVVPTKGELRDIQRRSRIRSGGVVTISEELAKMVARGEATLGEAIEKQRAKNSRDR